MIISKNKYKQSLGWGIKLYKEPHINPKLVAILLKLGKIGIFFFKNKDIKDSWPSQCG